MKKILITGANGFIGSNLCTYFLKKGFDVYGMVRETSDIHFLNGCGIKLITGDLRKPAGFDLPEKIDYIIHSASVVSDNASEDDCFNNIFLISKLLFEKINASNLSLKKFIYISTALTLGFDALNISEKAPGKSALYLPYVRYKKKTEDFFLDQYRRVHFPVTILRPADVYGPNDRTSCLLMLNGIQKNLPVISGHGNWYFGYCYSENLCQAAYLACREKGLDGRAYTVTNSVLPTWRDFFSGLQREMHRKQMVYVPVWFSYAVASICQVISRLFPTHPPPVTYYRIRRITSHTTYDISRTLSDLKYQPDNNTDQQIKEIVHWYRKEKNWKSGKRQDCKEKDTEL
jgi:nucleoside-diphosphate-sugar epimerase